LSKLKFDAYDNQQAEKHSRHFTANYNAV